MTIKRVREMLGLRPFRPFIIHLADGCALPIQPDRFDDIINLPLVTDLEQS